MDEARIIPFKEIARQHNIDKREPDNPFLALYEDMGKVSEFIRNQPKNSVRMDDFLDWARNEKLAPVLVHMALGGFVTPSCITVYEAWEEYAFWYFGAEEAKKYLEGYFDCTYDEAGEDMKVEALGRFQRQ